MRWYVCLNSVPYIQVLIHRRVLERLLGLWFWYRCTLSRIWVWRQSYYRNYCCANFITKWPSGVTILFQRRPKRATRVPLLIQRHPKKATRVPILIQVRPERANGKLRGAVDKSVAWNISTHGSSTKLYSTLVWTFLGAYANFGVVMKFFKYFYIFF